MTEASAAELCVDEMPVSQSTNLVEACAKFGQHALGTPSSGKKKVFFSPELESIIKPQRNTGSKSTPFKGILKSSNLAVENDNSQSFSVTPPTSDTSDTSFSDAALGKEMLRGMAATLKCQSPVQNLDCYSTLTAKLRSATAGLDDDETQRCLVDILKLALKDSQTDYAQSCDSMQLYFASNRLVASLLNVIAQTSLVGNETISTIAMHAAKSISHQSVSKSVCLINLHVLASIKNTHGAIGPLVASNIFQAVCSVPCQGLAIQQERLVLLQLLVHQHPGLLVQRASLWIKIVLDGVIGDNKIIRDKSLTILEDLSDGLRNRPSPGRHILYIMKLRISEGRQLYSDQFFSRMAEIAKEEQGALYCAKSWKAITALIGGLNLRRWPKFGSWLRIIQSSFNAPSASAKLAAHTAWRRLIDEIGAGDSRGLASKAAAERDETKLLALLLRPIDLVLTSKKPVNPLLRSNALESLRHYLIVFLKPTSDFALVDSVWSLVAEGTVASALSNNSESASECLKILCGILNNPFALTPFSSNGICMNESAIDNSMLPQMPLKWYRTNLSKISAFMTRFVTATGIIDLYESFHEVNVETQKREVRQSKLSAEHEAYSELFFQLALNRGDISCVPKLIAAKHKSSTLAELSFKASTLPRLADEKASDVENFITAAIGILKDRLDKLDKPARSAVFRSFVTLLQEHLQSQGHETIQPVSMWCAVSFLLHFGEKPECSDVKGSVRQLLPDLQTCLFQRSGTPSLVWCKALSALQKLAHFVEPIEDHASGAFQDPCESVTFSDHLAADEELDRTLCLINQCQCDHDTSRGISRFRSSLDVDYVFERALGSLLECWLRLPEAHSRIARFTEGLARSIEDYDADGSNGQKCKVALLLFATKSASLRVEDSLQDQVSCFEPLFQACAQKYATLSNTGSLHSAIKDGDQQEIMSVIRTDFKRLNSEDVNMAKKFEHLIHQTCINVQWTTKATSEELNSHIQHGPDTSAECFDCNSEADDSEMEELHFTEELFSQSQSSDGTHAGPTNVAGGLRKKEFERTQEPNDEFERASQKEILQQHGNEHGRDQKLDDAVEERSEKRLCPFTEEPVCDTSPSFRRRRKNSFTQGSKEQSNPVGIHAGARGSSQQPTDFSGRNGFNTSKRSLLLLKEGVGQLHKEVSDYTPQDVNMLEGVLYDIQRQLFQALRDSK